MAWRDVLETPLGAAIAGALGGVVVYLGARHVLRGHVAGLPPGVVPPRPTSVPFAMLNGSPTWPVVTRDKRLGMVSYTDIHDHVHGNWARQFHALREGRWHVGIDLYANNGDPVVAIADGTVVAIQSFHLGSWAILVEHDGVVALYGEVRPNSWQEFGVGVGSRVRRGQPIARIACMVGTESSCDSHMLHFETYVPGTRKNSPWYQGNPAPPAIRDPTWLLLTAAPPGANT